MVTAGRHTLVPDDVDCHGTLELGNFCSIASGLKIVTGQHPPVDFPGCASTFPFAEHGWGEYPRCRMEESVRVGSDVWIGQDVSILGGVKVGHGAILGACCVVTRDVHPYAVVAGVPARTRKMRFDSGVVEGLLALAWWNWTDEAIKEALPLMGNVRDLLRKAP